MALSKVAIDYQCVRCPEFARLHQQVREEVSEVSILNPLAVYQPLSGCICGKQIQRSPSCDRRHESAGSHDLLKSLVQNSKHSDRHRAQRSLFVKAELHGDRESSQIYLAE
jgi:hypothetical protein